MELRHIRYFIAVAEELNFTRAASRLGIGQPPLSQQIKDLEAELGVMLLRRVPQGAELTEAGRSFLGHGRQAIAASEQAVVAAMRASRGELGQIRLGFTNSAHFNPVVPFVISSFRQRHPELELELAEMNTSDLIDGLSRGTLDCAFSRANLVEDARFNVVRVATEALVAVLPVDHRCSDADPVALVDMAEERFIMKPRSVGPELHKAVMGACRRAGFEPKMHEGAPQLASVITFVAAGLGVSLVPASMQQIRAPGVTYRALDDTEANVALSVVWRSGERSVVVRNFIAMVREAFLADPDWPAQARTVSERPTQARELGVI